MSKNLEEKRIFLIVTTDTTRRDLYEYVIKKHISSATVYFANDGLEARSKIDNAPPHVVITDFSLPKITGTQLIEHILDSKDLQNMSIIVVSPLPQQEKYVDEIVTGRIQFLTRSNEEEELNHCVIRSLNYASQGDATEFHLRFLAARDQLIQEGAKADNVYILRKGRLRAFHKNGQEEITLGHINEGEFVGEMAFINGEPRTANVDAVTDCELIVIPITALGKVLYQRPSWSKALMVSLSKRLKNTNQMVIEEQMKDDGE